jgi:hypothetical protein
MSNIINIFRILKNHNIPIEEVSNKARFFLSPQIKNIENMYGYNFTYSNKISVIGVESMAYSIAIAEELSQYRINDFEWIPCLLNIFGDKYSNLFEYLFDNIIIMRDSFDILVEDVRKLAKNDVRNGMINCSNHLVIKADGMNYLNGDLELIYKEAINHSQSYKETNPSLTELIM